MWPKFPARAGKHDLIKIVDRRHQGFTLLEVATYTAVLSILGVPLVAIVLTATRANAENDVMSKVEERNRTALFRVESVVRKAIAGSAVVTDGGKTLQITAAAGFDGEKLKPGLPVGFTFRLAAGESLNGVDDNRSGIADEGELVWSSGAGEVVVCGDIDLDASDFALSGTGVKITVANHDALGKNGVFSLTKTMTVFPRN
jgi:type II secretory pathway pseudopilin PulG